MQSHQYVIAVHEVAKPTGGWWRTFDLMHPDGSVETFGSYEAAHDLGAELVAERNRRNGPEARLFSELAPLALIGAISLSDLANLVCRWSDSRQGGTITIADLNRLTTLRGYASLLKSFGQSSQGARFCR